MKGDHLMEIKAAALKSLTSIIHLDRNPNFPKLNTIIDVTGAASFHGFLPVMVRNCITSLTSPSAGTTTTTATSSFPQPLATALFSFLYHLASYEAGGEALVSCGMMESLLKVRNKNILTSVVLLLCTLLRSRWGKDRINKFFTYSESSNVSLIKIKFIFIYSNTGV